MLYGEGYIISILHAHSEKLGKYLASRKKRQGGRITPYVLGFKKGREISVCIITRSEILFPFSFVLILLALFHFPHLTHDASYMIRSDPSLLLLTVLFV